MSDILVKVKPVLYKAIVAAITMALIKFLPKLGVTITLDDARMIAGLGGTIIIGMGMNWAAKTHATIMSEAAPDSAGAPPETKP
jgi:hypothetical protein